MSSQETSPFFSVIIPTYNRAHSIGEAIESVLAQTFTDFELIVIDDGSTDATGKLVSELASKDHRVVYKYQQNQERSASRNNGISLSKGTYICFLDSDDLYLPNHLYDFHQKIVQHHYPKAMMVANPVYPNSKGEMVKIPPFIPDSDDTMELVIKAAIPSQLTCIHSYILKEHKFDINLRIGEDQELWTRIVKHYPLIKTEQYSVVIRDLGDRTINTMSSAQHLESLNLKRKIFERDLEQRIHPHWRSFVLSASYFSLAQSYLSEKNILKFYYYLLRSILLSPTIYRKEKIKRILKPKG